MARLSIVVPLKHGDVLAFEDTLASILRNRPRSSQVVVAHDGMYSDPHDLKSLGVQVVRVADARTYGELYFASLSHCTSTIVHWLRPGVMVDDGWAESAVDQFENGQVASVTPLLVSERHPDRILTAGVTCGGGFRLKLVGTGNRCDSGSRLTPLGPSAWAGFFRRSCLRIVAIQMSASPAANFDLELALNFRALGWLNVVDLNSVISMEHPEELVRSYDSINGIDTQRILWRHHPGTLVGSLKSSWAAGVAEILSALVSPRRGIHGVQRLLATAQIGRRQEERRALIALQQSVSKAAASGPSSKPTRSAA